MKDIYTTFNMNGGAINGLGAAETENAPEGSLKYDDHALQYFNGDEWIRMAGDAYTIRYDITELVPHGGDYTPKALGIPFSTIKAVHDSGRKMELVLYAQDEMILGDTVVDYEMRSFDPIYGEAPEGETISVSIQTGEHEYATVQTDMMLVFSKITTELVSGCVMATVIIYNDISVPGSPVARIQLQIQVVRNPMAFPDSSVYVSSLEPMSAYLDVKVDNDTVKKKEDGQLWADPKVDGITMKKDNGALRSATHVIRYTAGTASDPTAADYWTKLSWSEAENISIDGTFYESANDALDVLFPLAQGGNALTFERYMARADGEYSGLIHSTGCWHRTVYESGNPTNEKPLFYVLEYNGLFIGLGYAS